MGKADAVVLSDYAKGFLITPLVRGLIRVARGQGKPVVVDPKGAGFTRYRGATVIKPNRLELAMLTGLPVRDHREIVRAARRLIGNMGMTAVVVTQGKDGMTLVRREGREKHFPSSAREVYDVTGAGDTALATLGVALPAGAELGEAAWLSNLAAGLAVGELGTAAVSRKRVATALGASCLPGA